MNNQSKKIYSFFFNELIQTFPIRAHEILTSEFFKHETELLQILKTAKKQKCGKKFLDIGGGMGINAMILSHLFNFNCTVLDRMDEFKEEHNREVGSEKDVIARMNKYGVSVIKKEFISEGLPFDDRSFDIITCFDVIEHFTFSPKTFLSQIANKLSHNGIFFLSTPNQVHFYNRVKALLGKNTWEDFDYFYNTNYFYGHVREFTSQELAFMVKNTPKLRLMNINYSNYPFRQRKVTLRAKISFIADFLIGCVEFVCCLFPKLKYNMIAISKKHEDDVD